MGTPLVAELTVMRVTRQAYLPVDQHVSVKRMPVAGTKAEIATPTRISCDDKIKTEGVQSASARGFLGKVKTAVADQPRSPR